MNRVKDICSLPGLESLPAEVLHMIWDFGLPRALCRYSSALDFIDGLYTDKCEDDGLLSIPLVDVESWRRNSLPVIGKNANKPFVRLTVDYQGLREIETFKAKPLEESCRSTTFAYIVENAELLSGVIAQFKVCVIQAALSERILNYKQFGLGHLRIPPQPISFHIWDTPAPPSLRDCVTYPSSASSPFRLGTIDMHTCTGITFFLAMGSFFALHAHTPDNPFAHTTFECFWYPLQRSVSWVYVPIKYGIEVIGIRYPLPDNNREDDFFLRRRFPFCFLVTYSDKEDFVIHLLTNHSCA